MHSRKLAERSCGETYFLTELLSSKRSYRFCRLLMVLTDFGENQLYLVISSYLVSLDPIMDPNDRRQDPRGPKRWRIQEFQLRVFNMYIATNFINANA